MGNSAIEWTDKVWNPVTGCTKISQGCKNCYMFRVFPRAYPNRKPTDVQVHPDRLDDPLCWRKPCRVFVNSMSDLFHEDVPDEFIDRVFAVMALAREHTFQVLTKRPQRMLAYCAALRGREVPVSLAIVRTPWWESPQASPGAIGTIEERIAEGPLPNVWLGVSVEDQKTANERLPLLLKTPAVVRFISAEPLLGPISLDDITVPLEKGEWHFSCLGDDGNVEDDADFHGACLDWVICGGESGPNARPMNAEWAQSLRDQCAAANVSFFFKQWGEWLGARQDGAREHAIHHLNASDNPVRIGKKNAGRQLDGVEHNEFPKER